MLVQSDRAPVLGLGIRSAALLAAVTFLSACAANAPVLQSGANQAGTSQPASKGVQLASISPMLPASVDTCPDGMVVLMQSTTNQTAPFKEIYSRKSDGCYVTKEVDGQSITLRTFLGATHAQVVRNPEIAEAGFSTIVLNNEKNSEFTISSSRWNWQFNADIRLSQKNRNLYLIDGVNYPSVTIDCTTTVTSGTQFIHSIIILSKIPDTNYFFLSESHSDNFYKLWGNERAIKILEYPNKTNTRAAIGL